MADKSLTDFLGARSGQVKAMIENSSASSTDTTSGGGSSLLDPALRLVAKTAENGREMSDEEIARGLLTYWNHIYIYYLGSGELSIQHYPNGSITLYPSPIPEGDSCRKHYELLHTSGVDGEDEYTITLSSDGVYDSASIVFRCYAYNYDD